MENNYHTDIEAYFGTKIGRLYCLKGPPFEVVDGWYEQGIPMMTVLKAIDDGVSSCQRTHGNPPGSIMYRRPFVLEAFAQHQKKIAAVEADRQNEASKNCPRCQGTKRITERTGPGQPPESRKCPECCGGSK